MKNWYLFLTSCLSMSHLSATVYTLLLPKSQGYYQNHFLRPLHTHEDDRDTQQGVFSAMVAYRNSFKSDDIARALFNGTVINLSGSQVLNRKDSDLLADYFGLAPDFQGSLSMHPEMKTVTFDFFYHLDLSPWCQSLFIEIGAPLVHTHWTLKGCETIINRGMSQFPTAYMSPDANAPTAPNLESALNGYFTFGDMRTPWYSGAFVFGEQDLTRVADVSFALGQDIYRCDNWFLQAALLTIAPAGNKYIPTTNFYPVIGNADRWELGFTFQGAGDIIMPHGNTLRFTGIGTFTHPFDIIQQRMFDFRCRGALSRYMLTKQELRSDDQTSATYSNQLLHGVNFATRFVQVACRAQGDLTLQASYLMPCAWIDIGYNFFGRSAEKIHVARPHFNQPSPTMLNSIYVLKGTEGAYYRQYNYNVSNTITNEVTPPSPLNSSQQATIYAGGPVCNPQPITQPTNTIALTWNSNDNNNDIIGETVVTVTSSPTYQAPQESQPPCALTCNDLDFCSGAAPATEIHTLFARVGYHGETCGTLVHVSLGATGEFGHYGKYNALYQWGVWTQIVIQF